MYYTYIYVYYDVHVCVCENFNFHAFVCLGKHEDMKNVLRSDCVRVIGVYNNMCIAIINMMIFFLTYILSFVLLFNTIYNTFVVCSIWIFKKNKNRDIHD